MAGPLDGIRVIDVGTAGVGPWAATLLGLLGAEVLKIDSPAGDRHLYQPPLQRGLSTTYTSLNLNKRAAIMDLKDPALRPAVEQLIRQADVIMDNLRPGVVDRMGVGESMARAINPAIVSASSPAWGESGPFRNVPALDPQVQVFSGFSSLNGAVGGRPEMLRYPQLDFSASCYFASSIVLGLIARERNGHGLRVTASHLGSAITLQTSRLAEFLVTGKAPELLGSGTAATVPHQYFKCQDPQYLAIAVETEDQWQSFCRAVQREDLAHDPRFTTNRDRVANRDTLVPMLEALFASRSARWWALRLAQERVPHGFPLDFDRLQYHQQVLENGLLTEINPPHQGRMVVGQVPWSFSETPAGITLGGAAPGEHTSEIVSRGFRSAASAKPWKPSAVSSNGSDAKSRPPLDGYRVLDATQGYAGPFAGLLLAEAGAEVIKVEPPGGDFSRGFAPATTTGDSALFASLNRNKKSVVLDLDEEGDRRAYRALVSQSDIVMEDWGPEIAATRGLDYEALKDQNPKLIYCALSSFGERGPLRDQPGAELVFQAWSEYWKNLGRLGEVPPRVGADIAGLGTGVLLFLGAVAAFYRRLKHGAGQRVAISQLSTMMFLRTAQWAAVTDPDSFESETYCSNGTSPPRFGYQTKDRPIYFGLNNATESQYLSILEDLGMLDAVIDDPRFGNAGRDAVGMGLHANDVWGIWEKYFQRFRYDEVVEIINRHGGSAIEMRGVDEILDHPQVQSLDLLATDSAGNRYVRAPWVGPWQRPEVDPPPALDEHRHVVLWADSVPR